MIINYRVLLQIELVSLLEKIPPEMSWGTLFLACGWAIYKILKSVSPAVIKLISSSLEKGAELNSHRTNIEKEEESLSLQAKAFISELAKNSIETLRAEAQVTKQELENIRQQNNAQLIELGSLRARDDFREAEIQRLRSDVREAKETSVWARKALSESQDEISRLNVQVAHLRSEVERLQLQLTEVGAEKLKLQSEKVYHEARIRDLEFEVRALRRAGLDRKHEIELLTDILKKQRIEPDRINDKNYQENVDNALEELSRIARTMEDQFRINDIDDIDPITNHPVKPKDISNKEGNND